ncbi:MAG: 3-oxoacyl-ACP synthase [Bacteroidota bacterium]
MDNQQLKFQLYQKCIDYVEERLSHVQSAIDAASESGNDETKSSAGDKHETGRAMMQLEQEKNSRQLYETMELKKALDKINPNQQSTVVAPGSIVITNKGNFYISISAGKIEIGTTTYFAVSPVSPIAAQFIGLAIGKELNFNGSLYKIQEII